MPREQLGFTLIELMMVVAIVGVLAAVGLPAYLGYQKKAAYAEVLAQASPVKNAVTSCLSVEQDLSRCASLQAIGMPPPGPTAAFDSLSLNAGDLTITLTPRDYKGIKASETCDLKPVFDGSRIVGWAYVATSPCVTEGYVKG